MVKTLLSMITAVVILSGCGYWHDRWHDRGYGHMHDHSYDHRAEHETMHLVYNAVSVLEENGMAALEQFNEKPFRDGSTYVFVYHLDGVQIFHPITPEFDGKSRAAATDINGVAVIPDMVRVINKKGAGWTTYHWENPETGIVEPKRSFVAAASFDGNQVFIGSGYHPKNK